MPCQQLLLLTTLRVGLRNWAPSSKVCRTLQVPVSLCNVMVRKAHQNYKIVNIPCWKQLHFWFLHQAYNPIHQQHLDTTKWMNCTTKVAAMVHQRILYWPECKVGWVRTKWSWTNGINKMLMVFCGVPVPMHWNWGTFLHSMSQKQQSQCYLSCRKWERRSELIPAWLQLYIYSVHGICSEPHYKNSMKFSDWPSTKNDGKLTICF